MIYRSLTRIALLRKKLGVKVDILSLALYSYYNFYTSSTDP